MKRPWTGGPSSELTIDVREVRPADDQEVQAERACRLDALSQPSRVAGAIRHRRAIPVEDDGLDRRSRTAPDAPVPSRVAAEVPMHRT
jgi:hypothetical protein